MSHLHAKRFTESDDFEIPAKYAQEPVDDLVRSVPMAAPWMASSDIAEVSPEVRLTKDFRLREFRSRDGTAVPPELMENLRGLVDNLQVLRDHLARPVIVVSGYRSPSHNRRVGGASKSQHLLAKAADIRVPALSPRDVYCTIENLIRAKKMSQGGLGLYRRHVHYDSRGIRRRWRGTGVSVPRCRAKHGFSGADADLAPSPTPRGQYGTLMARVPSRRPSSYKFTAEDALWTARFIVGEAGGTDDEENRAVIWAMFNRYALFTNQYFPTFHQFIRRYSTTLQPVLRSWKATRRVMRRTDFVRTGGEHPSPPASVGVPRGQLRRHLRLQRTPWEQLPRGARSLAEAALRGRIANRIGNASDFASTRIFFKARFGREPSDTEWMRYTETYARRRNRRWIGLVPRLDQRRNAFFVHPRFTDLPYSVVRVVAG